MAYDEQLNHHDSSLFHSFLSGRAAAAQKGNYMPDIYHAKSPSDFSKNEKHERGVVVSKFNLVSLSLS